MFWESSLDKLRQDIADNIEMHQEALRETQRALAEEQRETAALHAQQQDAAAKVAALEAEAAALRKAHAELITRLANTERQLALAQVSSMPTSALS